MDGWGRVYLDSKQASIHRRVGLRCIECKDGVSRFFDNEYGVIGNRT